MKKKIFIIAIVVLSLAVWNVLYWRANQTFLQVPTEYFEMGQTVDIGSNYFDTSSENPEGYKLQIYDVKLKPYETMLEELKQSKDSIPLIDSDGYPRADYVYDVELKVKNEGNTTGYVLISRYLLIDKALTLELNFELWNFLYPEAPGVSAITLKPNTEKIIHLPFTISSRDQRKFSFNANSRLQDGNFSLCISEFPIRKMLMLK